MQNYGTSMVGSLVVQRVTKLPTWSAADVGRFLYDLDTENYYLGSAGMNTGLDGWIPLGIVTKIIKSQNVDWDVDISNRYGAISAKDIPILYDTNPTDIQTAMDDVADILLKVKKGTFLGNNSIKCNHLSKTGDQAVTANCIPIINAKSLFPEVGNSTITIEEALDTLMTRTADKIKLEENSSRSDVFGSKLNFTNAVTVQNALESLEGYLDTLTASDIPCTYEGCSCDTNVQFVIDALYKLHTDVNFTDLSDTPDEYDNATPFIKASGNKLIWTNITANDIICQYPGTNPGNVQQALWDFETEIQRLSDIIANKQIKATDVSYTSGSNSYVATNVGSALDIILTTFYSNVNKPTATDVSCSAIGGTANVNVQLALAYLNSQVNTLKSALPCSVGANDVTYASATGATDVAHTLTYILSFLDYLRSNHGVAYTPFSV